jgi:hypothetical protein
MVRYPYYSKPKREKKRQHPHHQPQKKENMKERLDGIAVHIIRQLKKEGITILRYNSYSSNSIYLKLDYGVLNSIRISDHQGKKHLAYRYNIIYGETSSYMNRTAEGWPRYFFPLGRADKLLEQIKQDRMVKLATMGYHDYEQKMKQYYFEGQQRPGFWQQAVEV